MAESQNSPLFLPVRHSARAAVGGQEEWVRAAVQAHGEALLRYAVRLLRPGPADSARDVVQDTFVKLCQTERSKVEDHLVEWLFTVCRNRTFDILRKESRMAVSSTIEGRSGSGEGRLLVFEGREPAGGSAHAAVEKPETTGAVLGALADLPSRQQEVLRLKFQAGLSYREIAGVMGLSVANVGFLIHCGIKTLRGQFARPGQPVASAER